MKIGCDTLEKKPTKAYLSTGKTESIAYCFLHLKHLLDKGYRSSNVELLKLHYCDLHVGPKLELKVMAVADFQSNGSCFGLEFMFGYFIFNFFCWLLSPRGVNRCWNLKPFTETEKCRTYKWYRFCIFWDFFGLKHTLKTAECLLYLYVYLALISCWDPVRFEFFFLLKSQCACLEKDEFMIWERKRRITADSW